MIARSSLTVSSEPESEPRGHVLAILPRGEAIRNFVYTDALDEVSRRAELSLLSVIPDSDIGALLSSRYENVYELRAIKEEWIVRIQREILDMAHGRWLWSEAARDRWRLRDLEASSSGGQLKRWAKKLACYPFANRRGLALLSRLEQSTGQRLRATDEYVNLLTEIKPSLVFNGSHVHSAIALPVVQAAQWLRIPTAAFIFSWDNLTSQGRIVPAYDYYLVWNQALKTQLLQIYDSVEPNQVFVTGTPQFDFHFRQEFYWSREEFCARVGADAARPIVLYSTGMANHMPGEPSLVEQVASILSQMTELGPPQLLVRVYPKDRTGRFEELKRRRPDIIFPEVPWAPAWLTPKIEDAYLLTNTLRHVSAGINVASTVSLELCMFDKPVINIGYNPPGIETRAVDYRRYYRFDHYRRLVDSGAIAVAECEDGLRELLYAALIDPQARSLERRALIEDMFGDSLDGHAGKRVAEFLLTHLTATGALDHDREPVWTV
jgi:hypothetical protein